MQRAYLETSAINHAEALSLDGATLRSSLEAQGLTPVIGLHTIYELARTFLSGGNREKGMAFFSILRDLEPSFLPPTWELLQQEVLMLRTGAAVLAFLNHLNQASTQNEIARLAAGTFDSRAESFIQSREQDVRNNLPRLSQNYLAHVREIKTRTPDKARGLRTFEDVSSYFSDQFPQLITEILKGSVSHLEALELSHRLNDFPALRSTVNANLYLAFIHIVHGAQPADDKINDYRHVIDASYSNAIVTGDTQLIKTTCYINPDLTVLPRDVIRPQS